MARASGSSNASRTYRARDKGAGLRAIAAAQLTVPGAPELVIFGHSHVPALERLGAGLYANAGAWTDAPDGPGPTYLVVTPDRVSLYAWPVSAQAAPPGAALQQDRLIEGVLFTPSIKGSELLNSVERRVLAEEQPAGAQEPLRVIGGDEPVRR